MSTFNPEAFINAVIPAGLESKFTSVPAGEYLAIIEDLKFRATDKGSILCDVYWNVLDEEVKLKLNLEKITVRQSMFLDLDANGRPETGINKNLKLGNLKEALGVADKEIAFGALKGMGPCKIDVTQRADDKDPTILYNDVKRVTRA